MVEAGRRKQIVAALTKSVRTFGDGWAERAADDICAVFNAHAAEQAAHVDKQALKLRAADALARAVDQAVTAGRLGSRSSIVDARLDYGDPRRYEAGETALVERLRKALEPFAAFVRAFDANPIRGLHDEMYGIHASSPHEAYLRLSDCRRALDALASVPATLRARSAAARKVIDIGVGVVESAGAYMVSRRPEGKVRGGQWEFAGGKMESDESPQDCIIREYREEFGITVTVGAPLLIWRWTYPDGEYRLHAFRCEIASESPEPRMLEGQSIDWVHVRHLGRYDWVPSAWPLLTRIALAALDEAQP